MNVKKLLLIFLIVTNLGLIITSMYFINSMGELESRLIQIEKEIKNPTVKIIPTD